MHFYFLDIETNSHSIEFDKDDQEIIQIGIYDPINKKEFSQCVNIGKPLSENIKRLTGITNNDIAGGINLDIALNNAIDFIGDIENSVIVGHNLEDFDLYLLSKSNSKFLEYNYIDTLHLFLFLIPGLKSYTVQDLYKYFIDSNYKEKHQALQDSKDEYELFKKVLNIEFLEHYYKSQGKDIAFLKDMINKYNEIGNKKCLSFKFISDILNDISIDEYTKSKRNLLKKYFNCYDLGENDGNIEESNVTNLLTEDDVINNYTSFMQKNGYSKRREQESIICHVKDVFNGDNKNLFIEAGTGTGKTFGYLLPAIQFIINNQKSKIFIATYTKVLQEQLMEKDIPIFKKDYPEINFELLKANTEAISLNNIPFKGPLSFWDIALWNRIYWGNFYLTDIHFSLQLKIGRNKLLSYVFNGLEYKENDEKFGFIGKFNQQLRQGNIFIINQAFMVTKFNAINKNPFTGLITKKEYPTISPVGNIFIIDEGHNLESVIRDFLTIDFTKNNLDKIFSFFSIDSTLNFISLIDKKIEFYESLKDDENGDENNIDITTLERLINLRGKFLKLLTSEDYIKFQQLYQLFITNFPNSKFYDCAYKDILDLRDRGYDTTIAEYDRNTFNELYHFNDFRIFIEYGYNFSKKLYDIALKYCKGNKMKFIVDSIASFLYYFHIGNILLQKDDENYFFDSIVEIDDKTLNAKNFGFKAIPLSLQRGATFLNESAGNIVLSATLFDKQKESYILKEIFGEKYRFAKTQKYHSPFDYKKQRKIYIVNSDDPKIKSEILSTFIEKYGGKTLILSNTSAEKRRLANRCKSTYEKEGILTLMHKSGTLDSKTNQRNVQNLRDNPNTILVGSKSYAEGVDVPGENLKLVVLTKLPFLPPSPFIKFQEKKRKFKGNNFVYKFLSSITFRQSIGRLIRTKNDTGDILILDNRLLAESGRFFMDYVDDEEIISIPQIK